MLGVKYATIFLLVQLPMLRPGQEQQLSTELPIAIRIEIGFIFRATRWWPAN